MIKREREREREREMYKKRKKREIVSLRKVASFAGYSDIIAHTVRERVIVSDY